MTTRSSNQNIHQALKKLRDDANAKELELLDLVASVYESVKKTQDKAFDTAKDAATTVNTSIHLHPWYYSGGAAAVGYLAGLIVRR
jgi:ElaB/YqjD/DUF883 family membrane-anchored ribosome-binding protein